MTTISDTHLVSAINKSQKMDLMEKELVCDEIFIDQPNLLASVLVQQKMGNSLEDVDVLLNILIVLHLAIKESEQRISIITEDELEHQLKIFVSTVKFTEGMDGYFVDRSLSQYIAAHRECVLLAYVIGVMKDANYFENKNESSKFLIMSGINLVNCIANAKRVV